MGKGKIFAAVMAAAMVTQVIAVTACGGVTQPPEEDERPDAVQEVMPEFDYSVYDNTKFSNYSEDGEIDCENLPGQWSEYGCGDPYVFRYNGAYYLYVSTWDNRTGVLAWKSSDMIHWEQCTGEGLPTGFVSTESVLKTAYAPEVYYFNGKFYMYTSPGGNGHYILSADSPEGPFKTVTGNYGMSIDGSLFIDDDESMYFLNASVEGIEIHTMNSPDSIPNSAVTLSNTKLGWTEGPMIIKRNGVYFLTYTGVHVLSSGYRVVYSTETDGNPLASRTAFGGGAETPLLLSTDSSQYGLGHSSTVLGPDMDSYYIVYHDLHEITSNGPWRSMNIDRLIFNGTQMSVDGSPYGSIAANLPEFSSEGITSAEFTQVGNTSLTKKTTGKVFTAEFNYTGDGVKCIVGYVDADNYAYVQADYESHEISLYKVTDGNAKLAAQGTLKNDFDPNVLHTVRVGYADGVADIYFDNMCKISEAQIKIQAGKIGYEGGEAYYTAFSNVARGYSDRIELKQSGAEIGAQTYLPAGAYEGLTSYKLSSGSRLTEYEATYADDKIFNGAYQLNLGKNGDFARYSTYFRDGGTYGMVLTYGAEYGGRKIGVQVNLGEIRQVTLPAVYTEDTDMVSAVIARLEVPKGANLITLYGLTKSVAFTSFRFEKTETGEISETLLSESGAATYSRAFTVTDEGHVTVPNVRMVGYFGSDGYADCEIEVEMKLNANNGKSAGLILRGGNFADSQYDDNRSVQGYYLAFSQRRVSIHKYNYNYSKTDVCYEGYNWTVGEWITVKAEVKGNVITVFVDGDEVLSFEDARAIQTGYFGLYGEGAEVVYRNLSIKAV